jgi:signal peptidase I
VGDGQAVFPAEQSDEEPAGFKSLLRETLETVILAVLIFLVIRTLVQNYRIEGQSMEPNFQHGQYLLVNKLAYRLGDYSRGDVIVFHYPNNPSQDYIKRVIGLPGDTIEFRDGVLMVNGLNVAEPYDQVPIARDIQAQTVAPGFLYVLGDNRPASSDTRTWGQLSQEFVIGKAWFAIWPVTDAGPVAHPPIELGPALEQSP